MTVLCVTIDLCQKIFLSRTSRYHMRVVLLLLGLSATMAAPLVTASLSDVPCAERWTLAFPCDAVVLSRILSGTTHALRMTCRAPLLSLTYTNHIQGLGSPACYAVGIL